MWTSRERLFFKIYIIICFLVLLCVLGGIFPEVIQESAKIFEVRLLFYSLCTEFWIYLYLSSDKKEKNGSL